MRYLKYLAYFCFCFFASAELVSVYRFYRQTNTFFYAMPHEAPHSLDPVASDSATFFRMNPYLGFMLRPGLSLREYVSDDRAHALYERGGEPPWLSLTTNNYGFYSSYNFPYQKIDEREFVVGVFGGSVAHWFALQGADAFAEQLRQKLSLNDRKIVFLNFAAGGLKQPQQLLTLNYFLSIGQKFDFVINIDGFNELALSDRNLRNGVSFEMPSSQHLSAFSAILSGSHFNKNYLSTLNDTLQEKDRAELYHVKQDGSALASTHLFYELLHRVHQSRYEASRNLLDQQAASVSRDSMLWMLPATPGENFAAVSGKIAKNWAEASLQMSQLLKLRNINYLHVLQPNQYVSKKHFSEAETPYITGSGYCVDCLRIGYPKLVEEGKMLRSRGISFLDATDVFDNETAITFSDNCCHLNQRGNEMLARKIGSSLVEIRNAN